MRASSVDAFDRLIIDQLRTDGRTSFSTIGRSVGLSEPAVRQRYNRMTKMGILQVVGISDAPRLDEVEAHLSIKVRGVTVAAVARQLAAFPEVKYVGQCLGEYDLTVDVRCREIQHLSVFVHESVRRIRGIEALETTTVLEIMKDTYLWAGLQDSSAE